MSHYPNSSLPCSKAGFSVFHPPSPTTYTSASHLRNQAQPSCAGSWGPLVAEAWNCLAIAASPPPSLYNLGSTGYIKHPLLPASYFSQLSLHHLRFPLIHKHASSLTWVQLPLIKRLPLSLASFLIPTLPHFVPPARPKCVLADKLNSNAVMHCPKC